MRVGSFKMAIFASFVHCLPIILRTWPHDSFQVIRLSMTLGIGLPAIAELLGFTCHRQMAPLLVIR